MHRKSIVFFIFIVLLNCCSIKPLLAFEAHGRAGARQASMGGASVTLNDLWALNNNPAGLVGLEKATLGIAYQNRFWMKELSQRTGLFATPTRYGTFGIGFTQFGFRLYNENFIRFAYARKLYPNLNVGVAFHYAYLKIANDYPAQQAPGFEIGLQQRLNSQLSMGAYLFNPTRSGLSKLTDDRLPVVMRFGLGFQFTDQLYGLAEIEKQSDRDPDVRNGIEYQHKNFFMRTGVAVNPAILTFGVGSHLGNLSIDIAAGLHQQLGATLQAGLQYQLFNNR